MCKAHRTPETRASMCRIWRSFVAICHPYKYRWIIPITATQHPWTSHSRIPLSNFRQRLTSNRIPSRRERIKICFIQVETPFPSVSRHIIQAVCVGRIVPYRCCITNLTRVICFALVNGISPRICLIYQSATCCFPPILPLSAVAYLPNLRKPLQHTS